LRQRVDALHRELAHREAWIKTELARHPQRPYFLITSKRFSPILVRSTATAALPMIRR